MSEGSTTRWQFPALPDGAASAVEAVARRFGLPPALARLLVCRGLTTEDQVRRFLEPRMEDLHDPWRMLGVDRAVRRLRAALEAGEPILVYGDYDVDGTVATVLLKTALERTATALGVVPDVRFHVPHRIREGYGIREARIAAAAEEGVRLVVSVDTGIRAFAAAEEAARLGLDLIVTDHHLPDESVGVPEAVAVLNPNQPGCGYPCKSLCGAAVAFKLAQALLEGSAADEDARRRLREKTLPSFLKLLAIATIADAVPLVDENRTIAALGLRELQRPAQVGLRALMDLAGMDLSRPISAMDIGFRLGPRLNAAGRMDMASDVIDLLLTRDAGEARRLAEKLHGLNDDRRAVEAQALREIEEQIGELAAAEAGLPACFVLDDLGLAERTPDAGAADGARRPWHRGVLGILASRVVDKHARPALVLAHEDGEAHGSGRSVPGFHLLDALTAAHGAVAGTPLFTRFGGHAHAVGFALPSAKVEELRERMHRLATKAVLVVADGRTVDCDLEVSPADLGPAFFLAYERMQPFGQGFPEPVFVARGIRLATVPRVLAAKHLRLTLTDGEGVWRMGAVAWSRRTDWLALAEREGWGVGTRLEIAFRLHRNWHPEFGGWEMELVASRPADSAE